MAYQGWLIKVGNYTISTKDIISADTYNVTYNSQDLDSYRDADGILHRQALPHYVGKIEFETRNMLTNEQMGAFMRAIESQYINSTERKATVTFYCPEVDDYRTQEMYMADPQFKIYGNYGGVIHYQKVRFAFIAY